MKALLVVLAVVCFPAASFAQAGLAGSVTDPQGAALSGVVVEASSPELLEKTRVTRSDAAGRYRLENLRPGPYQLRFSHPGWQLLIISGVELTGTHTATINAELALGGISETVSVASTRPIIDLQTAGRSTTVRGDAIRDLPTVRSYNAIVGLVPGVITNAGDTVGGPATVAFPRHGGRQNEGRLMLDGLNIGSPPSGNSATTVDIDLAKSESVTFALPAGAGESETAGLIMNVIPRAGGNTLRGSLFASGSGERLQSNNVTAPLAAQGVGVSAPYSNVYDVSGTLGGPIVRDRLWYFLAAHAGGSTRRSTNVSYNANAGDASQWLYAPDPSRPSYSDRTFESVSGRLTWQVSRRHKISGYWDAQSICRSCSGATPGLSEPQRVSPEAVGILGRRLDVRQVTWTSPATNRLLFEAGYGGTSFGVGNFEREPNPTRELIRVVEQCASGCTANGNIPGLAYRSQDYSDAHTASHAWKASVSYVTGTHSLKAGYQHTLMTDNRTWFTNSQALTYRFDNGAPNQLTQSLSPWVNDARTAWRALFVQDQWSWRQLSLQGAIRYDQVWSWFPEQRQQASRFLPVGIVIPESRGVDSYRDLTTRVGIVYDLSGSGRSVVKFSLGKYLEGAGVSGIYANTNPSLRMPQTTPAFGTPGVTRSWNDANRNFVPDCDLQNPLAQDLRATGGDACGMLSNINFGKNELTNGFDDRLLSGWGIRPSDWNVSLSFQQQLGAAALVDVSYVRRSFRGFTVADNELLQFADFDAYSITAPLDPRLPRGGGYSVSQLYDVTPAKAGQISNRISDAGEFGGWSQQFNGVDVVVSGTFGPRLTVLGGVSTGESVSDNCEVRAQLPELSTATSGTSAFGAGLQTSAVTPTSPYCEVSTGFLTQWRGLSSYLVPKIDLQVAATLQSRPGPMLAANYAVPNAQVVPSLGRDLSGNATSVTVNLIEPGAMYGERINQFDLRLARAVKLAGGRASFGLDVYNVLNLGTVLTYNNTFVPNGPWLQPLTLLTPRLFRLTAEFDW